MQMAVGVGNLYSLNVLVTFTWFSFILDTAVFRRSKDYVMWPTRTWIGSVLQATIRFAKLSNHSGFEHYHRLPFSLSNDTGMLRSLYGFLLHTYTIWITEKAQGEKLAFKIHSQQ